MNVSLLGFQSMLGRAVRASGDPAVSHRCNVPADVPTDLTTLFASPGFRITVDVQRSWSMGRAAKSARLTLSILPPEQSRQILEQWVKAGGGTASFFATEADAFLDFIAEHLPAPSHLLTICRLEQATLRASEAARRFIAPPLSGLDLPGRVLRASRQASLVRFYAEPNLVLAALDGGAFPAMSSSIVSLLFAPGLDRLLREATGEQIALWERLIEPVEMKTLLYEGHRREVIAALTLAGATEYVEQGQRCV